MNTTKKIGLIGFGVVGEGVFKVISSNKDLKVQIEKIAIKNPSKKRDAPAELFTTDVNDILLDSRIDTIVELIDDDEAAYFIVKQALIHKKNVVTANKKMLAIHLSELIQLQKANKVSLLYEAAVCGSIPILRNLEEYYNNDLLQSIYGIVNGSTNYILTQMTEKNVCYQQALQQAQLEGFAESNPTLDVEGFDAQNKLVLLLKHTFGIKALPTQIIRKGICSISSEDLQYAKEKEFQIKLIAKAYFNQLGYVVAYVMPQFIDKESPLCTIRNEYNGILIESTLADQQFLSGKGAGRYPTTSAVLSDISALQYGYQYEYKKASNVNTPTVRQNEIIEVYVSWKGQTAIDSALFIEIDTYFKSKEFCFLTGKINLATMDSLIACQKFSVVEMPFRPLQKVAPEILLEKNVYEPLLMDS
ncbi:MAG: homoserine dehydrogenase [Bacteroidetes bacterium]|nr:homoserine dehydrogenase [Bacteroidota bacterium]